MADRTHYRLLVRGELVQDSGLTVGGRDIASPADAPLARDGRGRLVLRGSGLAGAMVAQARQLYGVDGVDRSISAGVPMKRGGDAVFPSVWDPWNAHVVGEEPEIQIRAGVGIDQTTGARATGVLYDAEVVPRGTRWRYQLELRLDEAFEAGGDELVTRVQAMASAVLLEWLEGRCWLGADVARGKGWCHLDPDTLEVLRLGWEDRGLWPNTGADVWKDPALDIAGSKAARCLLEELRDAFAPTGPWHQLDVRVHIQVGEYAPDDQGSWGLDGLMVGGHAAGLGKPGPEAGQERHWVLPDGMGIEDFAEAFGPDASMVSSPNGEGYEPFLPGSSLRGPLRHALSWLLRREGQVIADPNAEGGRPGAPGIDDLPAKLFGTVSRSARLLIRDAYPIDDD